jgi:hypothetical protein
VQGVVSACACGSYVRFYAFDSVTSRTYNEYCGSAVHTAQVRGVYAVKSGGVTSRLFDRILSSGQVFTLLSLRPHVAAVGARWRINPRGVMADLPVRYRTLSSMINRYEYLTGRMCSLPESTVKLVQYTSWSSGVVTLH